MFVNNEELDTLRTAIEPLDTEEVRDTYRRGEFPRADRVKDLEMRYRWDLLHAARLYETVSGVYDRGGNDNHIDTALRRIVPPLSERKQ